MPTFKDLTGIELRVARAIPEGVWQERRTWLLDGLGLLRGELGLSPANLSIAVIHLCQGPELARALGSTECCGIGASDARNIWISVDLGPGPGHLRRGMEKVNDGTVQGVLRHEIGHSLEREIVSRSDLRAAFQRARPKADLSHYAASDEHEYFAEAFAAWANPEFTSSGMIIQPILNKALQQALPRR